MEYGDGKLASAVNRRTVLMSGSLLAMTHTGPATSDAQSLSLPRRQLFEPMTLSKGITLRNRVVMAPMTTWSSSDDATISNEEDAYYRRRVRDVGLVITGCTRVTPNGVGFTGEFASFDDRFIPSLRRLAIAAKSGGATAILQIYHAGNKAVPELVPDGDVVSASAVITEPGPFSKALVPRALSDAEIVAIISAFGEATRRAIDAGFDGVELHGAHGFLLQNFFSPHFNQRTDKWGGSLQNRMRLPLEVVREVRRVIDQYAKRPFVLGYRVSPEEPGEGRLRIADTFSLVDELIKGGVNYLHFSLSDAVNAKPIQPASDGTVLRLLLDRVAGRTPVIAAGGVRTPAQAVTALETGLPLVAVGQGLIMNPDWVALAREQRDNEIVQDIAANDQSPLVIPAKLWSVIAATPGWFRIRAG